MCCSAAPLAAQHSTQRSSIIIICVLCACITRNQFSSCANLCALRLPVWFWFRIYLYDGAYYRSTHCFAIYRGYTPNIYQTRTAHLMYIRDGRIVKAYCSLFGLLQWFRTRAHTHDDSMNMMINKLWRTLRVHATSDSIILYYFVWIFAVSRCAHISFSRLAFLHFPGIVRLFHCRWHRRANIGISSLAFTHTFRHENVQ